MDMIDRMKRWFSCQGSKGELLPPARQAGREARNGNRTKKQKFVALTRLFRY